MLKNDDILHGINAIADHLDLPYWTTQRLIEKKIISAGKFAGRYIASKRRIAAEVDKIASGETA